MRVCRLRSVSLRSLAASGWLSVAAVRWWVWVWEGRVGVGREEGAEEEVMVWGGMLRGLDVSWLERLSADQHGFE